MMKINKELQMKLKKCIPVSTKISPPPYSKFEIPSNFQTNSRKVIVQR